MRVISLWEPWATLVILGIKRWETRGWETKVRGPVLIHAAKTWKRVQKDFLERLERGEIDATISHRMGMREERPGLLRGLVDVNRGRILGGVLIDKMLPVEQAVRGLGRWESLLGDYSPGQERWAWRLLDPIPLREPILARGSQGFWKFPDENLPGKILEWAGLEMPF